MSLTETKKIVDKDQGQLEVLFTKEEIQKRVEELGAQITSEFAGCDELIVICVLKGSIIFTADLIRNINLPVKLEVVRLASYGNAEKSSGKVKSVDLSLPDLCGKNVVIIEDIIDTGLTASFLLDYLKYQHKTAKIKFATLLDKSCARVHPIDLDYVGFEVDDKFVVGFGLDYAGLYRNLPYIGYFPKS